MEADAALGRAPSGVVVDAPAGEHLDSAVVHADGHRHLEDAPGCAQHAVDVGIETGELGRVVEALEHRLPRSRAPHHLHCRRFKWAAA